MNVRFFKSAARQLFACLAAVSLVFSGLPEPARASPASANAAPYSDSSPAESLASDPATLQLPESLGAVQERFTAPGSPMVILIQDAHSVLDAQRSIRDILLWIEKESNIQLITSEGFDERMDFALLKSFPDSERLRALLDDYLREDSLSGVAAASADDRSAADFEGLENPALYEEGLEAYLLSAGTRSTLNENISRYEIALQDVKGRYYTPEMISLDNAIERFWRGDLELMQLLNVLQSKAEPVGLPGVQALLLEIAASNGNSQNLRGDIEELMRYLKNTITEKDLQMRLNGIIQAWQTSALSESDAAMRLTNLAETAGELPERFSDIKNRSVSASHLTGLQGPEFIHELEQYIAQVKKSLWVDAEAEAIDLISYRLRILSRLNRLELNREEWDYFKAHRNEFHWENLSNSLSEFGPRITVQGNDLDWANHETFYETAVMRDAFFVGRLKELFADRGEQGAVLVAGGFHTQGLTKLLKEEGLSYAVVVPSVGRVERDEGYEKAMRGEVSWLSVLPEDGKDFDVREAFLRGAAVRLAHSPGMMTEEIENQWREQLLRDLAVQGRLENASFLLQMIGAKKESDAAGVFVRPGVRVERHFEQLMSSLKSMVDQGNYQSDRIARVMQQGVMMPRFHTPVGIVSGDAMRLMNSSQLLSPRRSDLRDEGSEDVQPDSLLMPTNYGDDGTEWGHPFLKNVGQSAYWRSRYKYLTTILREVNPFGARTVAWYPHGGADVLHALLATNAQSIFISDRLQFGDLDLHESVDDGRLLDLLMYKGTLAESTLKNLRENGMTLSDIFVAYARLLGVRTEDIQFQQYGENLWRADFKWRHPKDREARNRTIFFISDRKTEEIVNDLSALPEEFRSVIVKNGGLDIVIEKGPNYYAEVMERMMDYGMPQTYPNELRVGYDKARSVNRLKTELLKPGGFIIGDKEQPMDATMSSNAMLMQESQDFKKVPIGRSLWLWSWFQQWGNGNLEFAEKKQGTQTELSGLGSKRSDLRGTGGNENRLVSPVTHLPVGYFLKAFGVDPENAVITSIAEDSVFGVIPVKPSMDTLETAASVFFSEGVRRGASYYVDSVKKRDLSALESLYLLTHKGRPAAFVWALPAPENRSRKTLIYPIMDSSQSAMFGAHESGSSDYIIGSAAEFKTFYSKEVAPLMARLHGTVGYMNNLNILEDPYHETFQSMMNARNIGSEDGFAFPGVHPPWDTSTKFAAATIREQLPGLLGLTDLKGVKVVDIGSGPGRLAEVLARLGATVYAYDIGLLKVMNTAAWVDLKGFSKSVTSVKARSVRELPPAKVYVANFPNINDKAPRLTDDAVFDYEASIEINYGIHPEDFREIIRSIAEYAGDDAALLLRLATYNSDSVIADILKEEGWTFGVDEPLPVPEGVDAHGQMFFITRHARSDLRGSPEEKRDANQREKYERIMRQALFGKALRERIEKLNRILAQPRASRRARASEITSSEIDSLIYALQSLNPHMNLFDSELIKEGDTILVLEVPGVGLEGLGQKELNAVFGEERVNRLTEAKRNVIQKALEEMLPEYKNSFDPIYASYKEDVFVVRAPVLFTMAARLREAVSLEMSRLMRDPDGPFRGFLEQPAAAALLHKKGIDTIDEDNLFALQFGLASVRQDSDEAALIADINAHQALTLGNYYNSMEFRNFGERNFGKVLAEITRLREQLARYGQDVDLMVEDDGFEVLSAEAASILRKRQKWETLGPERSLFDNSRQLYELAVQYFDLLRIQDYIKKWDIDFESSVEEARDLRDASDTLERLRGMIGSGTVITNEMVSDLDGLDAFLLNDPRSRDLADQRSFHYLASAMQDPIYVSIDIKNMGLLNVRSFEKEIQRIEREWQANGYINSNIRQIWRTADDDVTARIREATRIAKQLIEQHYQDIGRESATIPVMAGGDEINFVLNESAFPERQAFFDFLFRMRGEIRKRTGLDLRMGGSFTIKEHRDHFAGRDNVSELAHARLMLMNDENTALIKEYEAGVKQGRLPERFAEAVIFNEMVEGKNIWTGRIEQTSGNIEFFDAGNPENYAVRSDLRFGGDALPPFKTWAQKHSVIVLRNYLSSEGEFLRLNIQRSSNSPSVYRVNINIDDKGSLTNSGYIEFAIGSVLQAKEFFPYEYLPSDSVYRGRDIPLRMRQWTAALARELNLPLEIENTRSIQAVKLFLKTLEQVNYGDELRPAGDVDRHLYESDLVGAIRINLLDDPQSEGTISLHYQRPGIFRVAAASQADLEGKEIEVGEGGYLYLPGADKPFARTVEYVQTSNYRGIPRSFEGEENPLEVEAARSDLREPKEPQFEFRGGATPGSGNLIYLTLPNDTRGDSTRILLDAGTGENLSDMNPEAVVMSHGHLDHVDGIPRVSSLYPKAPLFGSYPTIQSALLNWSASAGRSDYPGRVRRWIRDAQNKLTTLQEGVWYQVNEETKMILLPAGHILGANLVYIATPKGNFLYSGDVSTEELRGALPIELLEDFPVDFLLLESTYGDRPLESLRSEREEAFIKDTAQILTAGGNVLIPAFVIGRIPELVIVLREYQQRGMIPPETRILVDGQAAGVLEIYERYLADSSSSEASALYNLLFGKDTKLEYVNGSTRSQLMNGTMTEPHVVLSGSGMLAGGRALGYLEPFSADSRNALFLVGWQAPESLGRYILDRHRAGEKGIQVTLGQGTPNERTFTIPHFEYHPFSGHAAQDGLVSIAQRSGAREIYLIHGDMNAKNVLKGVLDNLFTGEDRKVVIPEVGNSYAFALPPGLLEERAKGFNEISALPVPSTRKSATKTSFPAPGDERYEKALQSVISSVLARLGGRASAIDRAVIARYIAQEPEVQGDLSKAVQAIDNGLEEVISREGENRKNARWIYWAELVGRYGDKNAPLQIGEVILHRLGQPVNQRSVEVVNRQMEADGNPMTTLSHIESRVTELMNAGAARQWARAQVWYDVASVNASDLFDPGELTPPQQTRRGKTPEQRIREHVEDFRDSILRRYHPDWHEGIEQQQLQPLNPEDVQEFTLLMERNGTQEERIFSAADVEFALRAFLNDEQYEHRKPDGSPKTGAVAAILAAYLGSNRDWDNAWRNLLVPYLDADTVTDDEIRRSDTRSRQNFDRIFNNLKEASVIGDELRGVLALRESMTPKEAIDLFISTLEEYRLGEYKGLSPAELYASTESWEDVFNNMLTGLSGFLQIWVNQPGMPEERRVRNLSRMRDRGARVFAMEYIMSQIETGGSELIETIYNERINRRSDLREPGAEEQLISQAARSLMIDVLRGSLSENSKVFLENLFKNQGSEFQRERFAALFTKTRSVLKELESKESELIQEFVETGKFTPALSRLATERFGAAYAASSESRGVPLAIGEKLFYSSVMRGREELDNVVRESLADGGALLLMDKLGSRTTERSMSALQASLSELDPEAQARYRRIHRIGDTVSLARLRSAAEDLSPGMDPENFIVFVGNDDPDIDVSGQAREAKRLVFVVNAEVLQTLTVSQIVKVLKEIALAPSEIREFYSSQLGLAPDAAGRSVIGNNFIEGLFRLAAAEELIRLSA